MKRALVVGGTGFLGLNLVDALLRAGVEVRVTTRRHSITLFLRTRDVERVDASIEDFDSLVLAMRGMDAVFFAAGHYPRYSIDREEEIAIGVRGVASACRAALQVGVPRFVYTSSTGALDAPADGRSIDEDDVPDRPPEDSVYRAVKYAMEREVERWQARGLPAITLIPGGCIGPWDARGGTGRLLLAPILGRLPFWVEGTVPLVDVRDVADAHVCAAERAPVGARYALGGRAIRVSDLLTHIVARYGGHVPALPVAADVARALADEAAREAAAARQRVAIPRELIDLIVSGRSVRSDRAERELGARFRDLEESLDHAHAWFVSQGYLPSHTVRGTEARQ